ncbi:MAG: MoaD/ThiS family protein [Candidatus Bathyarchaeia archaeon]
MVQVRLRLSNLSQSYSGKEILVEAEAVSELLQKMRGIYPPDNYTFIVIKNGVRVADHAERLDEGDEVVLIPIFSGG